MIFESWYIKVLMLIFDSDKIYNILQVKKYHNFFRFGVRCEAQAIDACMGKC